jgi:hypothetical protein
MIYDKYSQCFCGNAIASTGTLAKESSCNTPCSGNNVETCGGTYLYVFTLIFFFGLLISLSCSGVDADANVILSDNYSINIFNSTLATHPQAASA